MTTSTYLRMAYGITFWTLTGCTPHVFSPPANIAPMESVAVASPGDTRLAGFATAQKLDFGPQTSTVSVRARQGLGHNFEVGIDANLTGIDTDRASAEGLNGQIGSARVSTKWSPIGNYFALTAGFGGGLHTAGQFIAPDIGVVLAYENEYLIPFVNISAYLSQPLNAKPVDISYGDEPAGTKFQTPVTTWGATWSLGLKLPLSNVSGIPFAPYLGVTGTDLRDETETTRVVGFTAGIDVTL